MTGRASRLGRKVKLRAEWVKYRLFPYERDLALREIQSLLGGSAEVMVADDEGVTVEATSEDLVAFARLRYSTYFQSIQVDGGSPAVGMLYQPQVEQEHWRLRDAVRRRQATRFGVHGLHEYRGKFNPQTARALMNALDCEADTVIDPFCGSGTTLVEALRLGRNAAGMICHPWRPS